MQTNMRKITHGWKNNITDRCCEPLVAVTPLFYFPPRTPVIYDTSALIEGLPDEDYT
jgi:hypothetical protein